MLSDKLITLANNTEKVFNAGYNKALKEIPPGATEEELNAKYQEGYSMGHAEGYIEGYNNGYNEGRDIWYQNGLSQGREEGRAEGRQAEYDRYWDTRQNEGKAVDYEYAFYGYPNELFNPKYDFVFGVSAYSANNSFRNAKITDMVKDCNFTVLNDAVGLTYTFYRARDLINARTLKVKESLKYSHVFDECNALKEIRFDGVIGQSGLNFKWSTNLSKSSIESIINALSSTTSGLTLTLSKSAVNNAFGVNVDDASTYPEGSEYYELRQSKSNWTISYV